jgi:hypothetical protein
MTIAAAIFWAIAGVVIGIFTWAGVTYAYWQWFLTDAFGWDMINFSQAIAINMIFGMLAIRTIYGVAKKSDIEKPTLLEASVNLGVAVIVVPLLFVGYGWIIAALFI